MSRLKISHTLIALFLMVGLIVTVLAVASLGGIKMMNERNNEIATTWLPRVSLSRALETQLSDTRMSFARHLISLTPFEKKAAEKVIGEAVAGFGKLSDEYAALMVTDADKAALDKVKSTYEAYLSVSAGMVKLSNNLENMKAQSVFKVEMRETEQLVDQAIKDMRALNVAGADAAVAASSATHDQIRTIELGVIAVAAFIVLGAILYAIRGIARPIQIITRSMAGLANGDTATAIPYGARKDEIGEMARAVEVFREAAISNLQLEEDAKVQRSQAEAERRRVTEEAEAAAQIRLQEATAGLATGFAAWRRAILPSSSMNLSRRISNSCVMTSIRPSPSWPIRWLPSPPVPAASTAAHAKSARAPTTCRAVPNNRLPRWKKRPPPLTRSRPMSAVRPSEPTKPAPSPARLTKAPTSPAPSSPVRSMPWAVSSIRRARSPTSSASSTRSPSRPTCWR